MLCGWEGQLSSICIQYCLTVFFEGIIFSWIQGPSIYKETVIRNSFLSYWMAIEYIFTATLDNKYYHSNCFTCGSLMTTFGMRTCRILISWSRFPPTRYVASVSYIINSMLDDIFHKITKFTFSHFSTHYARSLVLTSTPRNLSQPTCSKYPSVSFT